MNTQPRRSAFAALKSSINIVSPEEAQQQRETEHHGREVKEFVEVQQQQEPILRAAPANSRIPKTSRRGDPNYQQINAYVQKELHRAIKIELVKDDDREMSDLLEELMLTWLKKKGISVTV